MHLIKSLSGLCNQKAWRATRSLAHWAEYLKLNFCSYSPKACISFWVNSTVMVNHDLMISLHQTIVLPQGWGKVLSPGCTQYWVYFPFDTTGSTWWTMAGLSQDFFRTFSGFSQDFLKNFSELVFPELALLILCNLSPAESPFSVPRHALCFDTMQSCDVGLEKRLNKFY